MLTDDEIRRYQKSAEAAIGWHPVDNHPKDIAELCTRVLASEERVKVLEDAGTAILDFYNGPLEAKRPDVFQKLMVRLDAALEAGK